ncbi:CDP-glucose 4,6-dehydratase [Rhodoferax ferrireducens]|uniref:CDP-glucose 4,6-dehydratase n=1 Tax=Rhodoferax ferrireducens TaxID=192843 RepID=UPI000E0CDF18|nr:CDP-glucose 4,6-dehydratase [Rhodoferax ferrireducens]
MLPRADFWHGKRVLLTGHTGFKGAWLALWLQRLGAEVTGIALPPATQPSLFALLGTKPWMPSHTCDIRDAQALKSLMRAARPEIVLHLAAQALVRASYQRPLETFGTNVMGTANLLDALRDVDSARVVVAVTTDKVYQNREWHYPYREDDALGGHDPYSASKAATELVIASYRASYLGTAGVAVASARAGNVIGGGDWSEDRLIPDAVRAWQSGRPLLIRHPQATRPWQHVLEPLAGYLALARQLWDQPALAGAYNLGPHSHEVASVGKVVKLASSPHEYSEVSYENNSDKPHEAGWLALETAKARSVLGVQPCWSLAEAVYRTMAWYRAQHAGADARLLCEADIAQYEALT